MYFRVVAAVIFVGVASCSATNTPSRQAGGFYTWIDSQGNVHSVQSEGATTAVKEPSPEDASSALPTTASASNGQKAQPSMSDSSNIKPAATTPEQLWERADEDYVSDEAIEEMLDQRQRDRFVVYPDADGRVLTHPVDMVAEREARAAAAGEYEEIDADTTEAFVAVMTPVAVNCCIAGVKESVLLATEDEHRVQFSGKQLAPITLNGEHPSVTYKLAPDVARIELQSWIDHASYVHPQVVFLNANGEPVLLVDNLFSRRYPETFFAHRSLRGAVPVPSGAKWLVLFLPYMTRASGDWSISAEAQVPGKEAGAQLSQRGDVVLRGFAQD